MPSNAAAVPTAPALSGDARIDQPIISPRTEVAVMIRRLPSLTGLELYMTTMMVIVQLAGLLNGWEEAVSISRREQFRKDLAEVNKIVEGLKTRKAPIAPLPRVKTEIQRGLADIAFSGESQAQWEGPIQFLPDAYRQGQLYVQQAYFVNEAVALSSDLGKVLRVASNYGLYAATTKLHLTSTPDDADETAQAIQEAGRLLDAKERSK